MARSTRGTRIGWLALALAMAPVGSSQAAILSNVSIALNGGSGGNTPDIFDDIGAVATAALSTATVLSSSSTDFQTRYAAVVSADTGGSGSATTTQSFTANFTVSFMVTAMNGNSWAVTIDVDRVGANTIVSDGSGAASVTVGAMTGTVGGAGSLGSGSLDLATVGTTQNNTPTSLRGTSPNTPFGQTTAAMVSGIGTGAPQLVTLTFTFNASAQTIDVPGGGSQGDEAAVRLGLDSALSFFSADNYPGVGGRVQNLDGVIITADLEAPEPSAALLALAGLAAGLFRAAQGRARG